MNVFYELYFNIINNSAKSFSFTVNSSHLQVKNSAYAFLPRFLDSWEVFQFSGISHVFFYRLNKKFDSNYTNLKMFTGDIFNIY